MTKQFESYTCVCRALCRLVLCWNVYNNNNQTWGLFQLRNHLFAVFNILRLTGIVSHALNLKSLEPQQQARVNRWGKPKISRAPRWRAPRRRPRRTSPRTGRRSGTRRKVKRSTTNWLRQKSKNHLALLLLFLFFLFVGHKPRGCKIGSKFLSLFSSFSSCFLLLLLLLCPLTTSWLHFYSSNMSGCEHDMSLLFLSHSVLDRYSNEWAEASSFLSPPFDATHLPPLRSPPSPGCHGYLAARPTNGWLLLHGPIYKHVWRVGFDQLSRLLCRVYQGFIFFFLFVFLREEGLKKKWLILALLKKSFFLSFFSYEDANWKIFDKCPAWLFMMCACDPQLVLYSLCLPFFHCL